MLAALMAAAMTAAAPEAAGSTVNLLDAPGGALKFIALPSAAAFSAAYPHGAANLGLSGRAMLHCQAGGGGQVEHCKVVSETPTGAGFGGAALNLSHQFRLDPNSPAVRKGELDLPIGFATSVDDSEAMVTGPWLAAPSFAEVGAVYPDIGGGVAGEVVLHCALERDGAARGCKAIFQQPVGRDFDVAALKLASQFRMRIDPQVLKSHQPMAANVLLRIAAPYTDEVKQKRISEPVWLAWPAPARLAAAFPAAAAAKGVAEGVGLADCAVSADGALGACQPFGDGDPPGLGFSEAAAKAAMVARMSPWTDAGGPVDGAAVRVPVRFTQAAK